ncbi:MULTISPECIES: DUF262 domain-containing protein [Spirulina sp. CCY15215]|uniref:DUF262 domain-containing protein n=1 Tax=Spirulina sp. CCY15215 TaxID=2767591 RepID=UPI001EF2D447|nr:DUF262 domain-containing protein [Spirulina major]
MIDIDIAEKIDEVVGEVNIVTFDMTFGEIVHLYEAEEFIIQPEYQRLFRWTDEQKSRLIESILLNFPIPQIFVIERSDSVFELIDGLQRISSVIQFMNPSILKLGSTPDSFPPLVLQGCDLVKNLNGYTFEKLPLRLKLTIKRSAIRMVIIKKKSQDFLRYAMFKRLNTGGANLEPQEIRNCSARMMGDKGISFYTFLSEKAQHPSFKNCTKTLSRSAREKRGDEELVLRFFASKNAPGLFNENITDWLDDYMEKIILEDNFEYEREETLFDKVFTFLEQTMGEDAFIQYRDGNPYRDLAPTYYEAITVGTVRVLEKIQTLSHDTIKQKIVETVQSDLFKSYTGSGTSKQSKLQGRIKTIEDALLELVENE